MKYESLNMNVILYAGFKDDLEMMEMISGYFTSPDCPPVFFGQIGETNCCGSMSIYLQENLTLEMLEDFLKYSQCSILKFNSYGYGDRMRAVFNAFNDKYSNMAQLTYVSHTRTEHLVFVNTLDYYKYRQWYLSR